MAVPVAVAATAVIVEVRVGVSVAVAAAAATVKVRVGVSVAVVLGVSVLADGVARTLTSAMDDPSAAFGAKPKAAIAQTKKKQRETRTPQGTRGGGGRTKRVIRLYRK